MGIRTAVVLDKDVLERVRAHAREKSLPFQTTLNDLVRQGLAIGERKRTPFRVKAVDMGEFLLPFPIKVSDVDELEDKERVRRLG